jgi:hypothetical protein
MHFLSTCVLLCALAQAVRGWSPSNVTLFALEFQCEDEYDRNDLLYALCRADRLCERLYSLDSERGSHARNREKFWRQLRLFQVFGAPPPWLGEGLWPANITVVYNASAASCETLPDLSDEQRALVNYYALERMNAHQQYYSRLQCAHANQRLFWDLASDAFRCECLPGLRCHEDDDWHEQTQTVLVGLILGIFILVLLIVAGIGARLLTKY